MKNVMFVHAGKSGLAVWALLLGLPLAAPLAAQTSGSDTTTDDTKEKEVTKLEQFTVTGSYIPYSADAPAVPVTIVTNADIKKTGENGDLLEVIRKAVPQFIGNQNVGSANANTGGGSTNGGSQIRLRNVQTLVLINGRRAAFAPVSATGGYDFVDVDTIPVSAVERIEVLSDGASATYGSDAVSGVVNIILKKDYQGAEIGGSYHMATQKGHWEERSGRAIVGAKSGKTTLTVSAEWLKADPLYANERPFSADQRGKTSSFPGVVNALESGGNYLLNGNAAPPMNTDQSAAALVAAGIYSGPIPSSTLSRLFNVSQYVTLALGNERTGMTMAFSHQLNDNVELFGDVLYSKTQTYLQLAAQPIVGMPYFAANTENFGTNTGYTLAEHPQNPFDELVLVRNRFIDHPRGYTSDNHTLRVMTGARGRINERFSWEVGANLNSIEQDYTNTNVINRVALANAIDNNLINLFAKVQDPVKFAQAGVLGTAYQHNESSLNSFDARMNGDIPDLLPAGSLAFAVGAETRRETLSAAPDAGSYTINDLNSPLNGFPAMWDGATTSDPFSHYRTVDSVFAQVRFPITSPKQALPGLYTMDLDVAGRKDYYSDTDDPVVPKLLLRYLPFNDEFAIRATYSKSFSAQSLYTLFGPSSVGFTDQIVQFQRSDGTIIDEADQAKGRSLPNPTLRPERAKTYNLGIVYSPRAVKGLTVEASYFRIEQSEIAGVTDELDMIQDVELKGPASEYADRVRLGGYDGAKVTAPGQLSASYDQFGGSFTNVYVTRTPENFVSAMQDGVDLKIDYAFKIDTIGKFDVGLSGLWYHHFKVEDEDYVGTTNGRSVLNGGTIPRWRSNVNATYERGDWIAGVNMDYIPSVDDVVASPVRAIGSFVRWDIFAGYRFHDMSGGGRMLNGLSVRVGINNVFDRMPPLAPDSWTDANADTATYGALGRVVYVDASYKF